MLTDCHTKCLNLARTGGPDILWSENKLARAVTKWTRACDKRLARLISTFITQMTTDHVVMWVTRLNIVDGVYFKTQTLLETLKIQNQQNEESCVFSEVEHLFPKVGCARSKRQCLTVPQNRKLFLWMLVSEWTDLLPLICEMW